ncbi:MAG: hypothetical protein R6W87_08295 [Halospina sp.]
MMGAVAGAMGISQPQKPPGGASGGGGMSMPQPQINQQSMETSQVSEVRERRMQAIEDAQKFLGEGQGQSQGMAQQGQGTSALADSDPTGRLGSALDALA